MNLELAFSQQVSISTSNQLSTAEVGHDIVTVYMCCVVRPACELSSELVQRREGILEIDCTVSAIIGKQQCLGNSQG